MKGYKAFNKDLTCRDMQYEVGQTYEMEESPVCCERGYHFCKNIADVYKYYSMSENTRICEVVALGDVVSDDGIKYCTNKIKIVREIKSKAIKHCNVDKTDVGYCNSGNRNSGDWNSGDRNSGNWNSGNWNSGNRNSGDRNSGNCNSGYCNSGDRNSGYCNSGDWNSGDRNSGNWNSGDRNSGDRNSGNWNSGNWNSGAFNTSKNPTIKMFDKESDWTIDDWRNSDARYVLNECPYTHPEFISEIQMSDKEKENHPEYKTIGGYIKVFVATKENKQKWWDSLSEEDKEECYKLPNFDADRFIKCLGIEHI